MRWTGHVACIGNNRNAYRVLVGKPGEKGPIEIPTCRWKDTIKMDVGGI
jgi:hypothetical protein